MRAEFVELIKSAFPDFFEMLNTLEYIEISDEVARKVATVNHVVDENGTLDITRMWVPDHFARKCSRCEKDFGWLKGKHHCRMCGNVVCSACSQNVMKLPAALKVPGEHKCCDVCYKTREVDASSVSGESAADETRTRTGSRVGRCRGNSRYEIRKESEEQSLYASEALEKLQQVQQMPVVPEKPAGGFKKSMSSGGSSFGE
jgi:hypothetical protein